MVNIVAVLIGAVLGAAAGFFIAPILGFDATIGLLVGGLIGAGLGSTIREPAEPTSAVGRARQGPGRTIIIEEAPRRGIGAGTTIAIIAVLIVVLLIFNTIFGAFTALVGGILSVPGSIFGGLGDIFGGVIGAIGGFFGGIFGFVGGIASGIVDFFQGLF